MYLCGCRVGPRLDREHAAAFMMQHVQNELLQNSRVEW